MRNLQLWILPGLNLRDAQKADFKGNKIPAVATDGSVQWVRAALVPVMGRLVVLQRHKGLASNYDCETCYCPLTLLPWFLSMRQGSLNLLPGETHQMIAWATYLDFRWSTLY